MEFFKANTNINFMGQRNLAIVFSLILFVASIVITAIKGINLGLDFTGGTQIELSYAKSINIPSVRAIMEKNDFSGIMIQAYGSSSNILIRVPANNEISSHSAKLKQKLNKILPNYNIDKIEYIGPQVGKALMINGFLALLVSILLTMLYIAVRFEYRFAISAAVSLIHDPILIMGVFALFELEFNLISLAALLTIIGYSLNDTIVVYDRIRENFRRHRKISATEIVNMSINQTLSRTIMTSGLTSLVVIALIIYGGEVLQGFSIALITGIVIGTYSSIYIAGSLAVTLGLDRQSLLPKAKRAVDTMP
ncbi:MAG: protein translocase subunit SecF [Legionellales bacterium]|jgi:preprotein translocase subunit SecF|nr:protein translocase subunit SecF [Legionellales bacterium]